MNKAINNILLAALLTGNWYDTTCAISEQNARYAVAGLMGAGIIYAGATWNSQRSLNNAHKLFNANKTQADGIITSEPYHLVSLNSQELIALYSHKLEEYDNLCAHVDRDIQTLYGIQKNLDTIINQ